MGYWAEVRNNFFESENEIDQALDGDLMARISVDAWMTDKDDEQGSVIARVMLSKHGDVLVDYRDGIARTDEMAQAAIQEASAQLKEYFAEKQKEACKGSVASLGASVFVGWEEIDRALDRWAKAYFGEHVFASGNRDENDFEILLSRLHYEDYPKYAELFEMYDKEKDYEPEEEFETGYTLLPAEMTRRLMLEVLGGTGLVEYGTALATYDGVFFMEKGRNAQNALLSEKIQSAENETPALSLGAPAYVFFFDEENGVTHIDELKITDISYERIWLNDDFDYYFKREQIGEDVFLSKESAIAYAKEHGMKLAQPVLDEVIQAAEEFKGESAALAAQEPQQDSVLPWEAPNL